MLVSSLISIIFIIFANFYGISGARVDCALIYIPEKGPYSDHSLLLFINHSNLENYDQISLTSYSGFNVRTLSAEIVQGKYIQIDKEDDLKISLEQDGDHICDGKYAYTANLRERKVTYKKNNNFTGYVYRYKTKFDSHTNYENMDYYDLHAIARSAVIIDAGNNHYQKNTKYLTVCLSGHNDFAKNRCYKLNNLIAKKAYISKTFKLISSKDKYIMTCNNGVCNWWSSIFKFEIDAQLHYDKFGGKFPGYSKCYYKWSVFHKHTHALAHYVSDITSINVGRRTGDESMSIINEAAVDKYDRPDC